MVFLQVENEHGGRQTQNRVLLGWWNPLHQHVKGVLCDFLPLSTWRRVLAAQPRSTKSQTQPPFENRRRHGGAAVIGEISCHFKKITNHSAVFEDCPLTSRRHAFCAGKWKLCIIHPVCNYICMVLTPLSDKNLLKYRPLSEDKGTGSYTSAICTCTQKS